MTAFIARDPPDATLLGLSARAEAVWSLGALAGDYRRFLARFGSVVSAFNNSSAQPEQAFVVRTLLVHAYRRVRLRDPQLPREVLSGDWPGAAAYALARALYRATRIRADRFVRATLAAESEPAKSRAAKIPPRFVEST